MKYWLTPALGHFHIQHPIDFTEQKIELKGKSSTTDPHASPRWRPHFSVLRSGSSSCGSGLRQEKGLRQPRLRGETQCHRADPSQEEREHPTGTGEKLLCCLPRRVYCGDVPTGRTCDCSGDGGPCGFLVGRGGWLRGFSSRIELGSM